MSKFIETKLDCQFEDKKAFYRAEEKEDLLYYKKILRPKKEQVVLNFKINVLGSA